MTIDNRYVQRRRSVFRIGGGAKSYHVAKTLYVYLLTYIILYKNTAYFWGGVMMYTPILFIIGWAIVPPMVDTPGYVYMAHVCFCVCGNPCCIAGIVEDSVLALEC